MGSEFKRLRRYNATWTIFKALALTASVFLAIAGLLLVADKLHLAQIMPLYYILAVVAGLVVGMVAFLLMRKNDMRLAEQIDKDRKLRERVQTMVAYQHEDSAMLQMQREDTENRLKRVRTAGVRFYSIAIHCVILAIALTVFLVGMVMETQAVVEPPQPTEPPYMPSQWQISALEELIEHVQSSGMEEGARDATVEQLQSVRDTMDTKITARAMKEKVIGAITAIYNITDEANSNDDINEALRMMGQEIRKELAYTVTALSMNEIDFESSLDAMETLLKQATNLVLLDDISADILASLDFAKWDETDPMYAAVTEFARGLQLASDAFTVNKDMKLTYNRLGEAIHGLKINGGLAKEQQQVNKEECVYVVDTLCDIFGISASERPADPDPDVSKEEGSNTTDPSTPGGAGDGTPQFGSDDKMYDHENDAYVPYGDLIYEYYAQMMADIQDGKLEGDLAEMVQKYFGFLLKPVEDTEKENP